MKFGYTTLFVPDVSAAVTFYTAAFLLQPRFVHPGGDWAELETGETRLSFAARSLIDAGPLASTGPSDCFSVTLVTPDVAAAFARAVSHGATALSAPQHKPWGQTIAYVRDPMGFVVELGTPMPS